MKVATFGVTLKWYYRLLPWFIVKRLLRVKVISKEGIVIKRSVKLKAREQGENEMKTDLSVFGIDDGIYR